MFMQTITKFHVRSACISTLKTTISITVFQEILHPQDATGPFLAIYEVKHMIGASLC